MYAPLTRVLIRAPLLPVSALAGRGAARALAAHPLGPDAIAFASPSLSAAKPGPARSRAIDRYARRAAFRATPGGLLAGVCVGRLGPRADIATGTPVAVLSPSWGRMDDLARALLDDEGVRNAVRLRVAPSLLYGPAGVVWIGPGEPFAETRQAELDDRLTAVLDAAAAWTAWPQVRDAGRGAGETDAELDDLLLTLVDDGLLQTDLAPPLVGPPAAAHLSQRLRGLGLQTEADTLDAALSALRGGDRVAGEAALDRLPGRGRRAIQAVLVHQPRRPPRVPRAAVARAARLIPLLVRLQEALAPPAAERLASTGLADVLDACTETFGAGAFDLQGLATGAYGPALDDGDDPAAPLVGSPAVVAFLAAAFAGAARAGQAEAALDAAAMAEALGEPTGAPLPHTAELFLMPARDRRGGRPGDGWLLGLHAPAGASLGRFAQALGSELQDALAELSAAERAGAPREERLDVAFAPSSDLADLCAHPRSRSRALALSGWTAGDDLTLGDLAMVADPARPDALALRPRDGDRRAVAPSPLWRVRSTTAPAGAARLAAGWTLQRQHAPWAFTPGPLDALPHIPRVTLDGFVIAPASWRLPAPVPGRAKLARWRRDQKVPRHVQVGQGDELAPVDLDSPDAVHALQGAARVYEVWPPLDATIDRDGRRLEIVVPVVRTADAPADVDDLDRVPPPDEAPPLPGWRTFKLFGPLELQDALLLDAVFPSVAGARESGELDAWFFLRYEDGPGRRPHLRVRVHAPGGDPASFEQRLRAALVAARAAGALTSLETCDYFPERGRFAAAELDGLHAIFQADSAAVVALLSDVEEDSVITRARLFDALAAGFGLGAAAREALATERRTAAEHVTAAGPAGRAEADALFRVHGRALRAALMDTATSPLSFLRAQVAGAAATLPPGRAAVLLPTILHLSSVRWRGADPDGERLGYTLWQRGLEGIRRAPRVP